jgi:nucleoside-diphosphate-sugar epimerase
MSLAGKRVLITGATGFVGAHLAQRLAANGALVTGTGRNLEAVSYLRNAGVRLHHASLLDFATMERLLANQDIVFHAAAWLNVRHGSIDQAWAVNVYATQMLVKAAAAAGVNRVVYLSSIMAYGPPRCDVMSEEKPLGLAQRNVYGRTKAEGEQRALEVAAACGLDLVVIRPGMVYGPGSTGWTVRMVRLVKYGVPVIFGNGTGHAYPVYIDNLVDALLLAATEARAPGQAYNMVDETITWQRWFDSYAAMANVTPRRVPLWFARLAFALAERMPPAIGLSPGLLAYYTAKATYPHHKAIAHLGFRPAISFEEGMRRSEQWLRTEGYLGRK